jgi:hypothetical protein
MVGLYDAGLVSVGLIVSTVVGAALVLLARWRNWQLPEPYSWRPHLPDRHVGPSRVPRMHLRTIRDREEPP